MQYSRTHCASEMIAAHAPVKTRPAQWTPLTHKRLDVDPEIYAEFLPLRRELEPFAAGPQKTPLFKTVKDQHAQFTRKMVVANARLPQRRFSGAGANPYCTDAIRHAHETFEKLRHVAMRETKVAMPTLAFHSQQLRIKQLGKVRADSLLCYTRHFREFSCGKRLAGHQGRKNLGPGVVPDKRGDADDTWPILHGSILVEPLRRHKGVPFNRESHGQRNDMAIACFIRYEIDPYQRDAFKEYAENWGRIIPRCGGALVGYFLPHEGTNNIAWGLITFDSLAAYEAYRSRLKADREGRENFGFAQAKRLILREERTFVETVEGTFRIPVASPGNGRDRSDL